MKRLAVLMCFFVVVALACGGSGSGSGGYTNTQDDMDAYIVCKKFVEKQLKAPSTAKFQAHINSDIEELAGGRYRVKSYVDAENSFGAMINHFTCEVRPATENGVKGFRLVSLEFDE